MQVTLFKNIKQTENGHDADLLTVIEGIKNGHWKDKVALVRDADGDKRKELKRKVLPYFTPSGTFEKRNNKSRKTASKIISIDIDDLENPDEVKSYLAYDPYVWISFISVSGDGLCLLCRIKDPDKHLAAFNFFENYFRDNYGLTIDKACKDVARARFTSFDPDLITNKDAKELDLEKELFRQADVFNIAENMVLRAPEGSRHNTLRSAGRLIGGYVGSGLISQAEGQIFLEKTWESKDHDKSHNYKDTIKTSIENGMQEPISFEKYLSKQRRQETNLTGINEVAKYAIEILKQGRQWDENDVKLQCDAWLMSEAKVSACFERAFEDHAVFFGFEKMSKFGQTEAILSHHFDFKRNIVKQAIELKPKESEKYEKANIDSIYRFLARNYATKGGVSIIGLQNLKSLLSSDFISDYDPLLNYFNSLDHWDGKDHIADLANYVQTDDQEYFNSMFRKHLVRCIGCGLRGHVNRYVFTLVGERQRTGKSTFIQFLNPFPNGEYYTESRLRDDKDGQFALSENFIYNIEELSDMNNSDVNRLKAIISQSMIKERKPYGTDAEVAIRRCNFFGSTNNDQFLTDTENTRWLCFVVTSVDWGYSNEIDVNQVWAQAYALWLDKSYSAQLTVDESNKQSDHNKYYEVSDIGKDLIAKNFIVCEKKESGANFYSVADIMVILVEISNNMLKINSNIVGKNMMQLGFAKDRQKIGSNPVRGYWAKRPGQLYSSGGTQVDDDDDELRF